MKIVINNCYGGFGVSDKFLEHYGIARNMGCDIDRQDERLIEYIETYGSKAASDSFAHLVIEEVPSGTYYRICEYDGLEWIECRDEINWLVAD